jgi:hypothetical protein
MVLPDSDFLRKGYNLLVLVGGRYYNAGNSSPVSQEYLELCDLRFPLTRGMALDDEEANYLKRNAKEIEELRQKIEKEFSKGVGLEKLNDKLRRAKELNFFLERICRQDNWHLPVNDFEPNVQVEFPRSERGDGILKRLIGGRCAVINRRLYEMQEGDNGIFVNLGGKSYVIKPSSLRVEDVDRKFKEELERVLRIKMVSDSEKTREVAVQAERLDLKNRALCEDLKVKIYPYCFECGDIGFEPELHCVYWLIAPHYNSTTGGNYGEGQSAGALSMDVDKSTLNASLMFISRADRNSRFSQSSQSICTGSLTFHEKTLEGLMYYLRGFATEVYENGAFHTPPVNSDDS